MQDLRPQPGRPGLCSCYPFPFGGDDPAPSISTPPPPTIFGTGEARLASCSAMAVDRASIVLEAKLLCPPHFVLEAGSCICSYLSQIDLYLGTGTWLCILSAVVLLEGFGGDCSFLGQLSLLKIKWKLSSTNWKS